MAPTPVPSRPPTIMAPGWHRPARAPRPVRLFPFAWAWAVLCVGANCIRAQEQEKPEKVVTIEGITEYRYKNGLRFLSYRDPASPAVTVNMTILVGSRHEGYGEAGMAHLLEHMVFKGTPTHRDISEAMKARGAQFNGSTNPDRTNYFETLPASGDNLEFAIKLEADRL